MLDELHVHGSRKFVIEEGGRVLIKLLEFSEREGTENYKA